MTMRGGLARALGKGHLSSLLLALAAGSLLVACGGDGGPACVAGALRCGGDELQMCTEEGVFLTSQVCPQGCEDDGTTAACVGPGDEAHFVGSDTCQFCHGDDPLYATFPTSSHARALTRVDDGQAPASAAVPPPPGLGWADLRYVVGGQYSRALYVGRRGYVVTGDQGAPDVQYLLEDQSFAPYHTGEEAPFDCAPCHATGADPLGDPPHSQPGVVGSWSEDGVQCEACHGVGSLHATSADPEAIQRDASLQGCASCHTRTGGAGIEAAGGYILPNAQYEEVLASPHGVELACVSCHDPHSSLAQGGLVATCTDCHEGKPVNLGMGELACVDCHMPKVVLGGRAEGPWRADLRTHLVAIDPSAQASLFNEAGDRAAGALSLEAVCLPCHEDQDATWAAQTAALIHAPMPAEPHYVGDETCAACHGDIADAYQASGHVHALKAVVDGQAPIWPYTEVSQLPPELGWADVSYVVGGYRRLATFMDASGALITGDSAQLSLADQQLIPFHPEEGASNDCGACHATGYDGAAASQGGLPGVVGAWADEGVTCEACHGAGGAHVLTNAPEDIRRDASAAACGACHTSGDPEGRIVADGAFIRHEGQYEEWLASPHATGAEEVSCVRCHDPHLSSSWPAQGEGARPGLVASCESCHEAEAQHQKSESMTLFNTSCLDCHMPLFTLAAKGDPTTFTADVRTHIVGIDPAATQQIEGGFSRPALALDAACGSCHHLGGVALVHPEAEMKAMAEGYHDAP